MREEPSSMGLVIVLIKEATESSYAPFCHVILQRDVYL